MPPHGSTGLPPMPLIAVASNLYGSMPTKRRNERADDGDGVHEDEDDQGDHRHPVAAEPAPDDLTESASRRFLLLGKRRSLRRLSAPRLMATIRGE